MFAAAAGWALVVSYLHGFSCTGLPFLLWWGVFMHSEGCVCVGVAPCHEAAENAFHSQGQGHGSKWGTDGVSGSPLLYHPLTQAVSLAFISLSSKQLNHLCPAHCPGCLEDRVRPAEASWKGENHV